MWKVSFDFDTGSEAITVKASTVLNAIREAVATKAIMNGKAGDLHYVVFLQHSVYSVEKI